MWEAGDQGCCVMRATVLTEAGKYLMPQSLFEEQSSHSVSPPVRLQQARNHPGSLSSFLFLLVQESQESVQPVRPTAVTSPHQTQADVTHSLASAGDQGGGGQTEG